MKQIGWGMLLLLLLPLASRGQSPAQGTDTLRVSLSQALEIALSDNPTIHMADQEIQRVDYSKKDAWYALIPKLEASGQLSKYLVAGKMSMMGTVIDSPADFALTANLTLSLPLIAPALWDMIKMSSLDMQLAVEKARASKITLRNEVTKAYCTALLAQDAYTALSEGFALAEESYRQAKNRYEVGMAAEYDYISAEVQMTNLLPNLLQAENGIEQAKMYLKILMSVDVLQPLAIAGTLADYKQEAAGTTPPSVLFALDNNTDLKQLDIQQRQLDRSLSLQRTQRIPTLGAFGQFGYNGSRTNDLNIDMGGFPLSMPAREDWYHTGLVVGLQLNVPLSGIFTNTVKEKQMKIQSKTLALQREYVENSLNLQVRAAVDNMTKAAKQVEAATKGVELSRKGHAIAEKRYDTGTGTLLELQSATAALTQSQLSFHQALFEYLSAKADYEKIIGQE
jgi:outer membrane protein TolC